MSCAEASCHVHWNSFLVTIKTVYDSGLQKLKKSSVDSILLQAQDSILRPHPNGRPCDRRRKERVVKKFVSFLRETQRFFCSFY